MQQIRSKDRLSFTLLRQKVKAIHGPKNFLENSMVSVHLALITVIYYRQIIHPARFHSQKYLVISY